LPIAEGAAYDAHENEQLGCLPGTRAEILDTIQEWAKSAPRECIFWLNGGAGTGKSSIAFEAARILDEAKLLGASFFFKRAGGDRGNAKRLFPTLAQQLAQKVPRLQPLVARAVEENPEIGKKALREQWNHLVLQPVLGLEPYPKAEPDTPAPIVIVIDALDECDSEMHRDDVRTILQLLPQVQRQESIPIRFLVMSRPEHSIQLVFNRLNCPLRIFNLNNVRPEQIDRDISIFLEHALTDIRDRNQLSSSWPGDEVLQKIVQRTRPLFIAAVTLCRFIADPTWNPEDRLEEVLSDQNEHVSKMAEVYLPVLKRLLQGKSISETQTLVRDFRDITGAIMLLAEPLPCDALAELLGININKVRTQLSRLYSVLDCRDLSQPVKFLHISFRDYVLGRETKETQSSQQFWIDKKEVHQYLAMQCLRVMDMSLHKNICRLSADSIRRSNLDSTWIDDYLPLQLRYACRCWTYHLSRSHSPILLVEKAFSFLQVHFLHWIEALSLQGLVYEVVGMLDALQFFLTNGQHPPIQEFLDDARRFVLRNARLADCAPLQIYSSGLMFLPRNSIIRRRFFRGLASGIQISGIEDSWGAHVLTIEHDHLSIIIAIAISRDGKILASATSRDEICIWDTATGRPQHFFEVPGHITSLEISPNNRTLACGHVEGYISTWILETGDSFRVFDGWSGSITRMAFSADGLLLASLSGRDCIEVWNLATGDRRILLSSGYEDHYIAFSPTGVLLVACSYRRDIDLWDPATGKHLSRVKFGSHGCSPRGFSPDGKLMAVEEQGRIGILDLEKKVLCGSLPQYSRPPQDVVFLSGEILAALFNGNTIMLFNAQSGCTQVIKHDSVSDLLCTALSTDGKSFVSCSKSLINLWDLTTAPSSQQAPGEILKDREPIKPDSQDLHCLVFSPDGKWIASSSRNGVNLWNGATGGHHYRRTLRDFAERRSTCLSFSPGGELLAVHLADHLFIVWNLSSPEPQHIAHKHGWSKGRADLSIAFAPDGR
ncbi:WD40 repeat-like protein, partial [Aspergillus indologenus CBS 114.80]